MGKTNLGVLSAKVALDTVDFNRNLSNMQRELKIAKSNTLSASQGISAFGKNTKVSAEQVKSMGKELNVQKKIVSEYAARHYEASKKNAQAILEGKQKQGELNAEVRKAALEYNKASNELSKMQQAYELTAAKARYMNDPLKQSADRFKDMGSKLTNTGDKMVSVGKKWTATGAVIGGVSALGVKAAIDYESHFASVTKTVDGTAKQMDGLSDGIRKMALEVPTSAGELAELAAMAGQLGIKTPNILGFTRTIADLGVATNLTGEEGAAMLAKFANITKMDQSNFDRLGSSIVDLGNNFSTTEKDVMEMSMRLAGVGNQIGMTEPEILGLATAMSSVGIQAEAGGSAMTQALKKMQNAVAAHKDVEKRLNEAKENLDAKDFKKFRNEMAKTESILGSFARVAGMTSDDFSKLFNDDPAKALQKYVEGLSHAKENGENLNSILGEVEISGLRESDAMLRLAGNSELLGQAVSVSTKAWDKNNALTKEAETRYGTTASKMTLAKNRITEMGIAFGKQLLPVIADVLESSKPLIDSLTKTIEGFSKASPATKKFTLALGALVVGGGPALTMVGGLTKGVGSLYKYLGNAADKAALARSGLSTLQGGLKVTEKAAVSSATSLGGLATQTAGATTSVGGFGSMVGKAKTSVFGFTGILGGLTSPLGLATTALVVGAVAWETIGKKAIEASERTSRWGSTVDKETDASLSKFKNLSDGVSTAINDTAISVDGKTKDITKSFKEMYEDIKQAADKNNDEIDKLIKELPEFMQKGAAETAKKQKEINNESVRLSEEAARQVTNIYERHKGDLSNISEEEKQILINNTKIMNQERVRQMKLGKEEEKRVLAALNGDIEDMTKSQREQAMKDLQKIHEKEQEEYLNNLGKLRKIYGEGTKEYEEQAKILESLQKNSSDSQIDSILRMGIANGKTKEELQSSLEVFRVDSEQFEKYWDKAAETVLTKSDLIATSSKNASQETTEANLSWQNFFIDDKTGKVKTNLDEFIKETAQTDEGWKKLEFIIKNADLTSNSKAIIATAAVENGKWDTMKWEEQKLLIKDEGTAVVIKALEDSGKWNELDIPQKNLLLSSDTPEKVQEAMQKLGLWGEYPVPKKELTASTANFYMGMAGSQKVLDQFNETSPELKELVANGELSNSTILSSQKILDEFNRLPPDLKTLLANNYNLVTETKNGQTVLQTFNDMKTPTKTLTTDSSSVRNSGGDIENTKSSWDNFDPGPPKILTVKNIVENITKTLAFAKGTAYHPGGPALVNDQQGANYREAIFEPGKAPYIPEGRDVLLDLKRGTKVMPAGLTKAAFPRYAKGIGFKEPKDMLIPFKNVFKQEVPSINVNTDVNLLVESQNKLSGTLEKLLNNSSKTININIDNQKIASVLVDILDIKNGERTQLSEGRIVT